MKDKSQIINDVIQEVEATSYLEIGYGAGHNFKKIECKDKVSVDPNVQDKLVLRLTSNDFFDKTEVNYDVVFIDGLHHAEQVRKDIINAIKCKAKAIILHDTLPHNKAMQEVPRKQRVWTGNVWRAAVGYAQSYLKVRVETYRSDYGLTVIYPDADGKVPRKHFENMDMTYEEFKANEVELLNIID